MKIQAAASPGVPSLSHVEDPLAQRSVDAFEAYWRSLPDHLRKQYSEGEIPRYNAYVIFLSNQLVESLLPVRSGPLDWLECGCGRGDSSLYMRRRGHRTVLMDAGRTALEVARENFRSEGVTAGFVEGDLVRLGLRSARFDVVYAMGVLEHLAAVEEAVREMARVLRPGGRLILVVQIFGRLTGQVLVTALLSRPLVFLKHLLRRRPGEAIRRTFGRHRRDYYVNGWSATDYRRALEASGLVNIRVMNANIFPHLPIPACWEPGYVAVMRGVMTLRRALGIRRPFVTRTGLGSVWVVTGDRPGGPA
jgi:SAM-dependent methyltransferase